MINEKEIQFINEINKLNIREEVDKYKGSYKLEELHKKVIADKNSKLNKDIIKVEEIWSRFDYTIYKEEEGTSLKDVFMALDILLDIKFYIRDYILSFESEKLF